MAKIDRVQDLPSWFKLEKYEATQSFGAVEWYEQLAFRQALEMFDEPYHREAVRMASAALRVAPLRIPRHTALPPHYLVSAREDLASSSLRAVGPTTFMDLGTNLQETIGYTAFQAGQTDQDESVTDQVDGWRQLYHNIGHDLNVLNAFESSEPLNEGKYLKVMQRHSATAPEGYFFDQSSEPMAVDSQTTRVLLTVDLAASDTILKKEFAAWLAGVRSAAEAEIVPKRRPTFDRWSGYGILPYIDLCMWAKEFEIHIPDRVMAGAISRDHYVGEENLRKTIAPIAQYLLLDLSGLFFQAASEFASQSSSCQSGNYGKLKPSGHF